MNIAEDLRRLAATLRTSSVPLKDLIPLLNRAADALDAKQAKIDELMFEYCPEDMTAEQITEWGKHQRSGTEPKHI